MGRVKRLDWKKPVPIWSLLLGILLSVSFTVALLVVPAFLVPRPDFALITRNNSMSVIAYYCPASASPCFGNSTVLTLKPIRNFTGIVSITETASSPGITIVNAGLPNNILLGPAIDLKLSVQSATIGNYTITVTASSGSIIHTIIVPVIVQNMTFTLSTTNLTIARGSNGTVQMDMVSVNRLAGNLTMNGIVRLNLVTDPNTSVSFSPASLLLQPGGSAHTTVNLIVGSSAATGTRDVILTVNKASFAFALEFTLTIT